MGSDPFAAIPPSLGALFQSTLPVWGATFPFLRREAIPQDFNPRSPCGERQLIAYLNVRHKHFNPRSPCGERRASCNSSMIIGSISIHAPRVGSDLIEAIGAGGGANFNPRSPCGERPNDAAITIFAERISIHAPRVGSDAAINGVFPFFLDFNPRSPCGERR